MEKERKFSYKFSGEIKPGAELKERIEKIDGVLFCEINESESEISYALNEWASEYDALTAIIAILEECGLELEISEEDSAETLNEPTYEESQEEIDKEEKANLKSEKKADFIEKISVLSISLILFIVGLFLAGNKTARMWVFMISYIFAAYEILFTVITKAAEHRYCFEEFLVLIPTLAMLYIGQHLTASAVMFLYSTSVFLKKLLSDKINSEIEDLKSAEASDEKQIAFYEDLYSKVLPKESFYEKNKLKIHLAFVIAGVLVAFIPPLFKISQYGYLLLNKWLFIGSSIMIFGTFSSFGAFAKSAYYHAAKLLFNSGVIVKNVSAFSKISRVNEAVFDGATVVGEDFEIIGVETEREDFSALVCSAAINSKNPFFKALAESFKSDDSKSAVNFKDIEDKGVICEIDGKTVAVGNKKLLAELKIDTEDLKDGFSPVFVSEGDKLIGVIKLKFNAGNNAYGAVKEINEDLPIKTTLLSSDGLSAVNSLKKELGFSKATASCTKDYKISYLKKERAIYFGNHLLNAEVLSGADVSVSLGGENENSVAEFKNNDLVNAPRLIKVAARTSGLISRGAALLPAAKILSAVLGVVLFSFFSLNLFFAFFALDSAVQIAYLFAADLNSRDTI